eukprot:SAG31_NODE_2097_length_6453_cov_16.072867_9_plen_125_part_00
MQNLTVYEDSSPTELSKLVAQKFGLPQTSADRLRIEIEAQMVKRVQLRVNVDLQDGGAKQVRTANKADWIKVVNLCQNIIALFSGAACVSGRDCKHSSPAIRSPTRTDSQRPEGARGFPALFLP